MGGFVYRHIFLANCFFHCDPIPKIRREANVWHLLWAISFFAVLFPVTDSAANQGTGITIVSSGPEALRFSIPEFETVWSPNTVGDPVVTLFDVSVEGFVSSGEPGHPRLPRTGGWVVVPPGTRPELRIISENWQSSPARMLMVESVPVIIQGSDSWENSATEILVLPQQDPPSTVILPPEALEALARRGQPSGTYAVTLGDVAWWRGRRIVSFQMVPVRHDGSGMAVQVLASGMWEIRFVPDETAGRNIKAVHARKSSGRNDDKFGHTFLNGELLKQLPTEAVWQSVDFESVYKSDSTGLGKVRGGKAGTLLGPESRLAVWKTGLIRVNYSVLRDRGLLPSGVIREDQIRLYQRRYVEALDDGSGQVPYAVIEVPIQMVGEGDNFDGDDFLVFYGLRLRDDETYVEDLGNGPVSVPGCGDPWEMNNEANIYWLAASDPDPGQPWSRIARTTLPAAAGTPLPGYRRTDHIEEQVAFRENVPHEEVDRLYYNTFRAVDVRAGINPLWAPDPADSTVTIKIGVAGKNQVSRPLRFELITDSSLTTHLGDFDLATFSETTLVYSVPSSAIAGDFADIRMYNYISSIDWVFSFLNWVEISYHALYQATGDKISFHCGSGQGPQPVEIAGFTSADIGLFEITEPRRPVLVELGPTNITTTDNLSWTLSMMPDQSGQTRSFAAVGDFSTDGVDPFPYHLSSSAVDPANPTEVAGADPDMIVITHPAFRAELERWLEHRLNRADGDLNIHVVEVQDLYDWYSGGLKDPWALKRFATHAITEWNSWVLTVVGDANENVLGKGVIASARPHSKDWVPTHYHVQRALSYEPELMATDKWFATLEAGNNYPQDDDFPLVVRGPWAMYTGRFPCNSVAELDLMIDKVMMVENLSAGQTWRRRGIFFADDQWSNGYGQDAYSTLVYRSNETVFASSLRDSLSRLWSSGSPVALDSVLVLLETTLDPQFPYDPPPPNPPDRDLDDVRIYTGVQATPILISRLSEGGLVALYQGHANATLLASEFWFEDKNDGVGRKDVPKLGNTDKPWVFMGLGCHISDWAQNTVLIPSRAHEPSIAEKLLLKPRSGASALYASSGFEYITENRVFGEYIFRRWMVNPPSQRSVGAGETVRSRWILGELLWAAEADIYAVNQSSFVREMVSQYVLLGDPLMRLDADEPQITATLVGTPDQEISGEAEMFATSADNMRTINIVARDEAGIDRLKLVDAQGQEFSGVVVTETLPPGATDHQEVYFSLEIPVRPFDHELLLKIWDTGGPMETDRHFELLLKMPQTAVFSAGGEIIDPEAFVFPAETLISFNADVTSAAWLLEYDPTTDFSLTSETLTLTNTDFLLNKNQQLTVAFDAKSPTQNSDDQHSVVLTIDGYPTELVLQQGTETEHSATIGLVYNFPNPMRDSTRFVFESGLSSGNGTIRVFSVAGRPVARIPFRFTGGGSGIVDWDGRDSAGDEMGNGTYLYRVEIDNGESLIVSDMQRLVMMR